MKLLLVSDIVPINTVGGPLVLYRHLSRADAPVVHVATDGVVPGFDSTRLNHRLCSRILRKAAVWPAATLIENAADKLAISYQTLTGLTKKIQPSVLLTVAHGGLCQQALRLSQEFNIPLVTIFHDWWPDISGLTGSRRLQADCDFNSLIAGTTVALSVCSGMDEHLYKSPHVIKLPPMPPETTTQHFHSIPSKSREIQLRYIGNLGEYGEMIGNALCTLNDMEGIRFEARGASPRWPVSLQEKLKSLKVWDGFMERADMIRWLLEADILLVAMSFAKESRRQVETSFPSKIVEYTHLGKPIVVWGPDYCSAMRWARESNSAVCVTSPKADDLAAALTLLTPEDFVDLADKSSNATTLQFNPDEIQKVFLDAIQIAARVPESVS